MVGQEGSELVSTYKLCAGRNLTCTSQGSTTSTSFSVCLPVKPEKDGEGSWVWGSRACGTGWKSTECAIPALAPSAVRGHAKPWSGLCLAGNDLLLLMRWQKLAGSWNTASNAQTNAARPCLTQLSVWPSKGCSTGSTSTSSTQGHQRKPQKTTKGSQHFVL